MTAPAYDEPACDIVGRCTALESDRAHGRSNCLYCGKLLELGGDGSWYTWEAKFLPADQRSSQDEQDWIPTA